MGRIEQGGLVEALYPSRLALATCVLAVPILLVRPYVGVTYVCLYDD